jgi:hypothetical protein
VSGNEDFNGRTVGDGDVAAFALTGHPKAKRRCYGWSYGEELITRLELPPRFRESPVAVIANQVKPSEEM